MSTGFDHAHVDPPGGPRRGSTTRVLVAAAIAWGFLIIFAAMTVPVVTVQGAPVTATATAPPSPSPGASATPVTPVTPDDSGNSQKLYESPRVTVLRHDGLAGVAVASIPAAISLLVAGLLWLASRSRRTVLLPIAAWALSTALVVAGIVGFVTILVGIVAVPSGVLLVIACSQARSGRRALPAMSAST